MEPMMASILLFAGNFAPRGWMFCEGQLLSINQYQALFSLLGTAYGGDGRTTFALPDLRGRVPIQPGTGSGLSTIQRAQKGGSEFTTIDINNLPTHSHVATFTQTSGIINGVGAIPVNNEDGNADSPNPSSGVFAYAGTDVYTSEPANATNPGNIDVTGTATVSGTVAVSSTGGQQPFNNREPFLGLNYIIAIEGYYPSRS